jgi:hypothetical protein
MRCQRLYNPFVVALLRSPLHGFMSGSTMLLTYAGCRSGKAYTKPVNNLRDGDTLLVVSCPPGRGSDLLCAVPHAEE